MTPSPDEDVPDTSLLASKIAAVLGAVFTVVALGWQGPRAAASVFAGATVAVVNLLALRALIRALLKPERPKGGVGWVLLALGKMLFLFGGLWLLATSRLLDPLPMLVGYGVLPLGITASALFGRNDAG